MRVLAESGRRLGVFTDAPDELAQVALAHLGAARRINALETGENALERLGRRLGGDLEIVTTTEELLRAAT